MKTMVLVLEEEEEPEGQGAVHASSWTCWMTQSAVKLQAEFQSTIDS